MTAVLLLAAVLAAARLPAPEPASGPPPASSQAPIPASVQAPAPSATPAHPSDDRSTEVLRLDCKSTLGRREVTLFGNGTIRLREGPPGQETMGLAELAPDEMAGTLRRLQEEDLTKERLSRGLTGEWVEACSLALELPGKKIQVFHFGRYDALPLGFSRIVRIGEELGAKVTDTKGPEQLPEDYKPLAGDVLKRVDGQLYRVVAFTADRKGLDLEGVNQPLEIYVALDQLRHEFVALVAKAHR